MTTTGKIIAIIPARGGSKGLPRKNLREVAGRPLLAWSIDAARESRLLADFYVSTEDPEIKRVAQADGAKVLDRPPALATDAATTVAVLQEIVGKSDCDAVVVLQPTCPVRDPGLVDECIREYRAAGARTLATGFICRYVEYAKHNNLRRQEIPGFFYDDGNLFIIDRALLAAGKWYGEPIVRKAISREQNLDIDDEFDLFVAGQVLQRRRERDREREFAARAPRIRLLATDVDGVLTDGGMYYGRDGEVLKKFSTRDGHGLGLVRAAGIPVAFLTGEDSAATRRRAEKLKIDHYRPGCLDKGAGFDALGRETGLAAAEILYIGDDRNDLPALARAGLAVAVADALPEVRAAAHYVTAARDGAGAVREVCDLLLRYRGEGRP